MANTTISIGGFYTPTVTSANTFTVLFADVPSGTINFANNGKSIVSGGFDTPTVVSVITSNTNINDVLTSQSFTLSNSSLPISGGLYVATVSSVTRLSTFIQTSENPPAAAAVPSSQYWYTS